MHRDTANIPDETHPSHGFQHVIRNVNLPPIESLPRGSRIIVMVVVPAFAQSDQRQPEIVSAVIAGVVALGAIHMRERIDRAGPMDQGDGGDEKSPDQHLRAVGPETWRVQLQEFTQSEHAEPAQRRH